MTTGLHTPGHRFGEQPTTTAPRDGERSGPAPTAGSTPGTETVPTTERSQAPPTNPAEPESTTTPPTAVATTVARPPEAATTGEGGVSVPVVVGLLVVALLVGAALGWLARLLTVDPEPGLGRSGTTDRLASGDEATTRPAPSDARAGAELTDERLRSQRLAETLFEIGDRVANAAVLDRIADGLQAGGWVRIDPSGRTFDPDRMHAVDRVPTEVPGLDATVAEVERFGYADPGGAVVRLPEVVVFRYEAATSDGVVR